MCFRWRLKYSCYPEHYVLHTHTCYAVLVDRPWGCLNYDCTPLNTGIPCEYCTSKNERDAKQLKSVEQQEEVRVCLEGFKKEHERLKDVLKRWREAIAGLGERSSVEGGKQYLGTAEWREDWNEIVRDEVGSDFAEGETGDTTESETDEDVGMADYYFKNPDKRPKTEERVDEGVAMGVGTGEGAGVKMNANMSFSFDGCAENGMEELNAWLYGDDGYI